MPGKVCRKCGHVSDYDQIAPEKCGGCGAYYAKVEAYINRRTPPTQTKKSVWAKVLRALIVAKNAPKQAEIEARSTQNTLVRTYTYRQQNQAVAAYQREAAELREEGFTPIDQLWVQGRWGCFAFFIAAVLCPLVIGFFALAYLIIVLPAGTLTVTYRRTEG